jgi:hypothetical protein
MIAESLPTDENGVPILKNPENVPLFLPSAFPSNICAMLETKCACKAE